MSPADHGDQFHRQPDKPHRVELPPSGMTFAAGHGILLPPEAPGSDEGNDDGKCNEEAGHRHRKGEEEIEAVVGLYSALEAEKLRRSHAQYGEGAAGAQIAQEGALVRFERLFSQCFGRRLPSPRD